MCELKSYVDDANFSFHGLQPLQITKITNVLNPIRRQKLHFEKNLTTWLLSFKKFILNN